MPREIFLPFDAVQYGHCAHDDWYRSVDRLGVHGRFDTDSARAWWGRNIEIGCGYYAFGMPFPSSEDDIAMAFDAYMDLTCEALRDRRAEEYEEPLHPARAVGRWERVED